MKKYKRLLSGLLIFVLLLALLPAGANAAEYSGTCGEKLTWRLNDSTLTISGEGEMRDYFVSETLPPWASSRGEIKTIVLEEGVTSVGKYAFYSADNLTKVALPSSLKKINAGAFSSCRKLPSISIPEGVLVIGSSAFSGCEAMKQVTLSTDLKEIGEYAFAYCENLTGVVLPSGLSTLGEYAFSKCIALTKIDLPAALTEISAGLFNQCTKLESVTIPVGVKRVIGSFDGCSSLKRIVIPEGVTEIGVSTFSYCTALESVTIPDSVSIIGDNAFYLCSSLRELKLPAALTEIGNNVFARSALESVKIPQGVTKIGRTAFSDCSSLAQVTLPEGLTEIGDSAFSLCKWLTSIRIPASVRKIGDRAFIDCIALSTVYFMGDAPTYTAKTFDNVYNYSNRLAPTLYCIEGKAGWTVPEQGNNHSAYFDPNGHMHSFTTTIVEATCAEDWKRVFACECGETHTIYEDGTALHHTSESLPMPEATCTAFGWYGGWHCKVCKKVLDYPSFQPMLPHSYVNGVCSHCGAQDLGYTDLPQQKWYISSTEYAIRNGLMNGVGDKLFDPDGTMTRAMLVTVLWRYEGEPNEGTNTFVDVPAVSWFTDAVAWAAENDIVNGVGNNKFDPEGEITREQMATILYRYAQKKNLDMERRNELGWFRDIEDISDFAVDGMLWMIDREVIKGTEIGGALYLDPQGDATRAQVAAILMRFIEAVVKQPVW